MSCNPLLGVTRHGDKGFEVIETERSPIAPYSRLILEWAEKVVAKNGPFSVTFFQIVALILPHHSAFAPCLLVGILFPPFKTALKGQG